MGVNVDETRRDKHPLRVEILGSRPAGGADRRGVAVDNRDIGFVRLAAIAVADRASSYKDVGFQRISTINMLGSILASAPFNGMTGPATRLHRLRTKRHVPAVPMQTTARSAASISRRPPLP